MTNSSNGQSPSQESAPLNSTEETNAPPAPAQLGSFAVTITVRTPSGKEHIFAHTVYSHQIVDEIAEEQLAEWADFTKVIDEVFA